jgi:hypothetical protein
MGSPRGTLTCSVRAADSTILSATGPNPPRFENLSSGKLFETAVWPASRSSTMSNTERLTQQKTRRADKTLLNIPTANIAQAVSCQTHRMMTPAWRRRFLTWGIAIAVFGMRIVLPVLIVAIIARIDPFSALMMATTDPDQYSRVLNTADVSVSALEARSWLWLISSTFSTVINTCTDSFPTETWGI